ncbi:PIN domain-containing protein [Tsukamurella sp. NPDC003166]|uniref:PIN domain-containing protein n=1 Tax=Tsukamurella sp. NPDC003166 TaxID=3154444 RepID=UPI00339E6F29
MRQLLFDTKMLIAYERGTIDATRYDEDDIAIGAITLAEFRVGIELADTAERAAARSAKLAALEEQIEVLEYTPGTAAAHARLIAHTKRSGTPRGAYDLIIAAHAAESGRRIVSTDSAARFGDLPGVDTQNPE